VVKQYWKGIVRRAFNDSLIALHYTLLRVILGLLLTVAVLVSLKTFGSADAWKDETIAKVTPWVLFLITFPLVFLWNLFSAPARVYGEQISEIGTLKAALAPTLRLSFAGTSGFKRLEYGKTSTTMGGRKQTVITSGFRQLLLIDCKNISAMATEKCEAFLVAISREDAEAVAKPIQIDAIPLPWMPIEKEKIYQTSIPSEGHRNVLALQEIQGKVYLHTDNVPVDYIHMFDEVGTYIVTVMVCPNNGASVRFRFKLVTGPEPGVEPIVVWS